MSIPFFRIDDVSNDLVFVINTERLFEPSPHFPTTYSSSEFICYEYNNAVVNEKVTISIDDFHSLEQFESY